MDRIKKILFLITLSMLFNINMVKAEQCSDEQIKELKALTDNIIVDIEFSYESADAGIYDSNYVTIQGLPDNFYIYADDLSVLFTTEQQDESGRISRIVKDGVKKLNVYSTICPNEVIRTIKLKLNTFNPYSAYEECEGIDEKDLEVCDEFYDKEISEEQFLKEVKEYKEETRLDNLLGKDNKLLKILIPIVGIVIVILIIILIKKRIKDNRLD